jgi:VWFA-related protein
MRIPLLALLLATGATTQQDATFRANTRIVEIGIVATRQDKPVTDLREQDLRLFDNDRPRKILSFEKATPAQRDDSPGAATSKATDSAGADRFTYILLDALNTSFSDQVFGREGVAHMLGALSSGGRIEILVLGDTLRVLHGFSADYDSLRYSVEKYQGEQPSNWTPELNKEPIRMASPMQTSDERQRILNTLQAVADIAADAKSRPGRKKLIWVSSCFPTRFTSRSGGAMLPEDFAFEVARDMRKLVAAGVALYPVSPQGLKPAYPDSMREMAERTGGKAFLLSNDVAGLVRAAVDEPSENYLVTFAPTDDDAHDKDDGSYHEVRIVTSRRGVDLRYRPGYIAGYTPKKP